MPPTRQDLSRFVWIGSARYPADSATLLPKEERTIDPFESKTFIEFATAVRAAHAAHGVTEIVAIYPDKTIYNGYFISVEAMVEAVRPHAGKAAIYFGLNPRHPTLLKREATHLVTCHTRARDEDVAALTLMLVDVDVCTRGRKSAATQTGAKKAPVTLGEHTAAVQMAAAVREALFPGAAVVPTNGAQLHVPIDVVDSPAALKEFAGTDIKATLLAIADDYDEGTAGIVIDRSVWSPSRLAAVPGTLKPTGKATRKRPHRMVGLRELPDTSGIAATMARLSELSASGLPDGADYTGTVDLDVEGLEPLEELCPTVNVLLTEVARHHKQGDRSRVLFILVTWMKRAGLSRDTIVDLIVERDWHLGRKLVERYDARAYVERMIDTAGPPSCKATIDAVGTADRCVGCPEYRGGSRGYVFDLHDKPSADETVTIDEARARIRAALKDA